MKIVTKLFNKAQTPSKNNETDSIIEEIKKLSIKMEKLSSLNKQKDQEIEKLKSKLALSEEVGCNIQHQKTIDLQEQLQNAHNIILGLNKRNEIIQEASSLYLSELNKLRGKVSRNACSHNDMIIESINEQNKNQQQMITSLENENSRLKIENSQLKNGLKKVLLRVETTEQILKEIDTYA